MRQLRIYFRQWRAARQARKVSYEGARARVTRGAAYLDDVDPAWHRQVDPATLELASGHSCVLGQLHGDFRAGLIRARLLNMSSAPRASLSPVSFGFQCVAGVNEALQAQDYAHLTRAWQEAIRRRQAEDWDEEAPPAASGDAAMHEEAAVLA